MALAETTDVEALLLRSLTDTEMPFVSRLLGMAGHMVMRHLGLTAEPATIPQDLAYVTAELVARLMRNPDGLTSETLGPYNYQRPSVQFTITPDLAGVLSRYAGTNGMGMIRLTTACEDMKVTPWLPTG